MEEEDGPLDLKATGPFTTVIDLYSTYIIPELKHTHVPDASYIYVFNIMFRHTPVPRYTSVLREIIIVCCESVGNCQTLYKDRPSQLVNLLYFIIFILLFFSLYPMTLLSYIFLYVIHTISISILQNFRSWIATSNLRPPMAFLSHNSSDTPGLARLMNVLSWGRCDFPISFSDRDMSRNVWNRL